MACIDQLVTLGICPDEDASTSGFTLLQAPGMNLKNFANIAIDSSGIDMVMEKKALTILQLKNDFIGEMQMRNVVMQQSSPVYNTSVLNPNINKGTYTGFRGLTLHKNAKYRGRLRKTRIKSIDIYSFTDGETQLKLDDGINTYTWDIELVANSVNTFNETNLDDFPYTLSMDSDYVRVLVDTTNVELSSAEIRCMIGCNGTMPNDCGWANGWDGSAAEKSEGYGVNVNFQCDCDYEQLICDTKVMGELMWLKWQINVYEEQEKSNRFSNLVVYSHEEIRDKVIPELYGKYNAKWSNLLDGLYGILKTYRDDCLDCRRIRRVPNL